MKTQEKKTSEKSLTSGDETMTKIKRDDSFIISVARDRNIPLNKLTSDALKRAHSAASKYNEPQDYYDALKDFFNN